MLTTVSSYTVEQLIGLAFARDEVVEFGFLCNLGFNEREDQILVLPWQYEVCKCFVIPHYLNDLLNAEATWSRSGSTGHIRICIRVIWLTPFLRLERIPSN